MLRLTGEGANNDRLLASAPLGVRERTDYVLRVPVTVEQGRAFVSVETAPEGRRLGAAFVDWVELTSDAAQPTTNVLIPFASGGSDQVRLVIAKGDAQAFAARIGEVAFFEVGASRREWTRLPRLVFHLLQRLFVTAVMLPLVVVGAIIMARARRWRELAIILVVPVYYFCVQSALHTEYRYVLAVHCFLFILAAVGLCWIGSALWLGLSSVLQAGVIGKAKPKQPALE